jgi:8-oxo-dGTP diphosphatase
MNLPHMAKSTIRPRMSGKEVAIGVGAVVFRGAAVLVIRRGKPPFEGRWSIPGGGLLHGERLEDAVRREVFEETGLEIALGGLIGVFEAIPGAHPDPALDRHVVMIDYWATSDAGAPVAGDDAAAAEFVDLSEAIRRVSWNETKRAIEAAAKLRDIASGRP